MSIKIGNSTLEIEEFCKHFAIVIDPADDDQIWVKVISAFPSNDPRGKEFKVGGAYTLSDNEKINIPTALGIKITIPTKRTNNNATGTINIGGNVEGSNIIMGSNNTVSQELRGGYKLSLNISGSGVKVVQI